MADRTDIPIFKNPPILVLVLGYVTCGLYMIYWNMKAAEVLNRVSGKEVIAPWGAFFAGCCLPLNISFFSLAAKPLGALGRMIGKKQELREKSTILIILGLLFPPVAAMIVQGHINELYPA